ncbi:MAG TPA: MMPL family transporter [Natrialbaceae archaeon]|nr:MMPL family transporter [Natrialbaceae archaeon]
MLRPALKRSLDFVTEHTRITLLMMVLVTGLVLAGIPQLDTTSQAGGSAEEFQDVERVQKWQYVQEQYGNDSGSGTERTFAIVYVHDENRNVLSKSSLLAELRFQREVQENESLSAALHDDGILGLSNLVASRVADEGNPDLDAQIRALEDASQTQVERLVEQTLANDPRARRFLPADHDPARTTASDRRLLIALNGGVSEDTRSQATAVVYERAERRSDAGYFTLGEHAIADFQDHSVRNLIELVLPLALLLILFVLAFSYRDLVDIVVGMTGVVLSVLWMLGLLGWLGVAAGTIVIVPIVLITGLSIDFGFHVFNRYREQRDENDPIRASMSRGVRLVATALLLVTITAAIGFLANLANPLPIIRNLGVSITLGVVSALVIFTTVVPALKIGIDGLLERFGRDRHKAALGRGRYLEPVLSRTVPLAKRAAPIVVLVAILVGAAGGVAWTALEEESYQQSGADVAEWKQELPDPIGWDVHEFREQQDHVDEVYQPASADAGIQSRILLEGDVTADSTLERVHDGSAEISETGVLVDQPGTRTVRSPVTAMRAVASRNETFAAAFQRSDTDGNGVPDSNLETLYDRLYAADEATASRVVERTDGKYRSILVTFSLDADYADAEEVVPKLVAGAETMAGDGNGREATVAGSLAVNEAILEELVDGILLTMVIALIAILLAMVAVFKLTHDSASLGVVVAIPIALVLGMVIGGMYLLDIPLTLLTALLISLVIGLGIDYNIHVGDRFADELRAGKSPVAALEDAVTGTGGALLGSTLTSAGAFATIVLVPSAQLQSFGRIVVLALVTAFLVSVLVLPSLLWLWARFADPTAMSAASSSETVP